MFGCISTVAGDTCPYNYSDSACNFGIAVGVISFIGLMIFLVTDALFDNMSNIQHRKYVVYADAAFSGKITLHLYLVKVEVKAYF